MGALFSRLSATPEAASAAERAAQEVEALVEPKAITDGAPAAPLLARVAAHDAEMRQLPDMRSPPCCAHAAHARPRCPDDAARSFHCYASPSARLNTCCAPWPWLTAC